MGRIKSTIIKKTAKRLVESITSAFSENFGTNKKALKDTMPSKPIRNKVAGYISRLVKMQKQPKQKKIETITITA